MRAEGAGGGRRRVWHGAGGRGGIWSRSVRVEEKAARVEAADGEEAARVKADEACEVLFETADGEAEVEAADGEAGVKAGSDAEVAEDEARKAGVKAGADAEAAEDEAGARCAAVDEAGAALDRERRALELKQGGFAIVVRERYLQEVLIKAREVQSNRPLYRQRLDNWRMMQAELEAAKKAHEVLLRCLEVERQAADVHGRPTRKPAEERQA